MKHSSPHTQLGTIELFCRTAELGHFARAAQAHGVTPGAVSRTIARLEARLGVQLFARTTRQVRLTEHGRTYYEECRQALSQIHEVERVLGGRQMEPSGILRVSMPTTYAHYRILPLLPEFIHAYPKVELTLSVLNRNVDFIEEGFDLAIRLGVPSDSRLIVRKLEDAPLGIYVSPVYAASMGIPQSADELSQHRCIEFVLPSTGRAMPWLLATGTEVTEFSFESTLRFEGDVLGCVRLAEAGGGIYQTYEFVAADAVRRGTLIEVLKQYKGATRPFSVLYPANRHMSMKQRVFIDFFAAKISVVRP